MSAANLTGTYASLEEQGTDINLPPGWGSVVLKELASHRKGKKPKRLGENLWQGAVPYIDIEAFETGSIRRYADADSSVLVNEGDVVVVWDGARCGHVGRVPVHGGLGSTLMNIKPFIINPDYLLRFLQMSYETINSNPRGTGIPHVEPQLFWNLQFPIAPLQEQKRIVGKVEELLARVNAVRERLSKVKELLKRFRQSVFAAACSGRLTEDWRERNPNVESASELLRGLISKKDKTNKFPVAYKAKGHSLNNLRETWLNVRIKNFVESIKYGTSKKCDYDATKTPVLRIPNVINGYIDLTNIKYAQLSSKEYEQLRLSRDDILMVRSNGSVALVGKTALVTEKENGYAYAGYLIRLRFNSKIILPSYINLALSTYKTRLQIEMPARSTSGVHNINSEEVGNLEISLPPLEEQREIVRRVDVLFNLADTIEKRLTEAKEHTEKLTQAILAKAFSGELVPTEAELARREGRSYEPASSLLTRIIHRRKDFQKTRKEKGERND